MRFKYGAAAIRRCSAYRRHAEIVTRENVQFYAEGGRYYIAVLHGDRDAPRPNQENYYTLEVKSRNPGEEEREPNDSAASTIR